MPEVKNSQEKLNKQAVEKWNELIEGFLVMQTTWEDLKKLLARMPNQDTLNLTLQRNLTRIGGTTQFRHAVPCLVDLLGIRSDVKSLFIEEETNEE